MVDVRVGEHDRVDLVDRRAGVRRFFASRLAAAALEQPAVEQDRLAVRAHDVAGAGDLAGGAGELDLRRQILAEGTSRARVCVVQGSG